MFVRGRGWQTLAWSMNSEPLSRLSGLTVQLRDQLALRIEAYDCFPLTVVALLCRCVGDLRICCVFCPPGLTRLSLALLPFITKCRGNRGAAP